MKRRERENITSHHGHFFKKGITFFFFFFLREQVSMSRGEGQRERERESQAGSVLSAESDVGLDLMTLGSQPEPTSRVRHSIN